MKNQPASSATPVHRPLWLGAITLLALVVAGCVVTSVYPYYTAKDLTFDPALLGTWHDPEKTNADAETWTFDKLEAQTYKWTVRDGNKTNEFDTHLFSLGGTRFLDALPRERHDYTTPSHVLLRVTKLQPQLELENLSYDWLAKLLETDPKALRHVVVPKEAGSSEDGGLLTLTADTAELQKFIRKHVNNTNAWGESLVMKKK